jgi:hypothetical protein
MMRRATLLIALIALWLDGCANMRDAPGIRASDMDRAGTLCAQRSDGVFDLWVQCMRELGYYLDPKFGQTDQPRSLPQQGAANALPPLRSPTPSRTPPVCQEKEIPPDYRPMYLTGGFLIFPQGAKICVVYDRVAGQLAVASMNRYFPLFGIEPLLPAQTDFERSAAFQQLRNRMGSYEAVRLECGDPRGNYFKCFLSTTRGGRKDRYDIAKFALTLGAARTNGEAPEDYQGLERQAKEGEEGNWRK